MLPLELEFLIIESVTDNTTLSACSRVCQAWRSLSQACLFHSLSIVLSSKTPSENLIHDFISTLKGSLDVGSDVGHYVRHLVLDGDDDPSEPGRSPDPLLGEQIGPLGRLQGSLDGPADGYFPNPHFADGNPTIDSSQSVSNSNSGRDSPSDIDREHIRFPVRILHHLLPLLPQLSGLSLERLQFYDELTLDDSTVYCSTPPFAPRRITNLLLDVCSSYSNDINHLFDVLSMFSTIDQLYLDCGSWNWAPSATACSIPPSPIIRRLILESFDAPDVLAVLCESIRLSGSLSGALTSVHYSGCTRAELDTFLPFAAAAGPHLTALGLDVFYALVNDLEPAPHAALGVDLGPCPRLETLTLSFDFAPVADAAVAPWDLLRVVRAALALYARVLAPQAQAFLVLREIAFQVFCATAAPAAFACAASVSALGEPRPRDGEPDAVAGVRCALWGAVDAALCGLPALETVRFLMCDVERGSEAETVEAMRHFVGEQLPRTCKRGIVEVVLEEAQAALDERALAKRSLSAFDDTQHNLAQASGTDERFHDAPSPRPRKAQAERLGHRRLNPLPPPFANVAEIEDDALQSPAGRGRQHGVEPRAGRDGTLRIAATCRGERRNEAVEGYGSEQLHAEANGVEGDWGRDSNDVCPGRDEVLQVCVAVVVLVVVLVVVPEPEPVREGLDGGEAGQGDAL
ncbi:uncharacterized protein BXZ73DRAFT_74956 [Epithele typhae]|uniref:uncharacterized protein n=1 Tax=Epithele typhae TaxID=378194 RepID=UPI00200764B4|nr:uncharacterized protein BXZ73DRAFT_74956 [Epithele typhae]KAH9941776.1 hypothetical protein BXZ73DRAFT_74956 [Epithele typhae]